MSQNGLKEHHNGMAMVMPTLPSPTQTGPWLQLSVRDFFTHVNWTDQPPEVQAIQISALQGDQPGASLQLTVSQFFSAIPWDGRAVAAPLAAQTVGNAPKAQEAPGFTVDDFAGLF